LKTSIIEAPRKNALLKHGNESVSMPANLPTCGGRGGARSFCFLLHTCLLYDPLSDGSLSSDSSHTVLHQLSMHALRWVGCHERKPRAGSRRRPVRCPRPSHPSARGPPTECCSRVDTGQFMTFRHAIGNVAPLDLSRARGDSNYAM